MICRPQNVLSANSRIIIPVYLCLIDTSSEDPEAQVDKGVYHKHEHLQFSHECLINNILTACSL